MTLKKECYFTMTPMLSVPWMLKVLYRLFIEKNANVATDAISYYNLKQSHFNVHF